MKRLAFMLTLFSTLLFANVLVEESSTIQENNFEDGSDLLILDPSKEVLQGLGSDTTTQAQRYETLPAIASSGILDDLNSWGDWASEIQNGHNTIATGSAFEEVAGNDAITDPDYVNSLIQATHSTYLTYDGQIFTNDKTIGAVKKSEIHFNFTFGYNNPYVEMDYLFETSHISITEHALSYDVRADGFSFTTGTSELEGQYYGNNMQQVKGNIQMEQPTTTHTIFINGTFKADKH